MPMTKKDKALLSMQSSTGNLHTELLDFTSMSALQGKKGKRKREAGGKGGKKGG